MAVSKSTLRVQGLRELNRDLGRMNKAAQKDLQKALRVVAEPVAADARAKAARFGPATAGKIAAGSSRGQAVVRQRARRTTGKRPDFGALQYRTVLLPALEENEGRVLQAVEMMLETLALGNGFHH